MIQSEVTQLDFGWKDDFLNKRVEEAKQVIFDCAMRSRKPLIVQFSGGRDSMVLMDLVRQVTNHFVCAFMATGIELPGVVDFVQEFAKKQGVELIVSYPYMHKGDIFERTRKFKGFPNLGRYEGGGNRLWCNRDLKLRPQKKLLNQLYGKGTFYRLEGIRRFESERRRVIYKAYTSTFMRPDSELKGSYEVFPILNWNDEDVLHYIEKRELPTLRLYKEFGVSGCSWCPFYGPDIYAKVIEVFPYWYDEFIALEEELNVPSVQGGVFLRDIKSAVLEGKPLPEPRKSKLTSPDMMEFKGKIVKHCEVYGHLYMDGVCYRCGIQEENNDSPVSRREGNREDG